MLSFGQNSLVDFCYVQLYTFKPMLLNTEQKMPSSAVLVLSKNDYTKQAVISLPSPALTDTQSLPLGIVLVRTSLISLTANNLLYARGGFVMHWGSTYPVPSSLPKPYNMFSIYGIVPARGYGTVLS